MKILITRKIETEVMKIIPESFDVVMWEQENSVMPRDLLLKEAADADAIFTNVTDRIDEELFLVQKT